jgi:hypothetical protein
MRCPPNACAGVGHCGAQGYESGKLRSFSTSNFAKAYVLKSMGWWDVGLLTTCTAPRTHAPPLHEVRHNPGPQRL